MVEKQRSFHYMLCHFFGCAVNHTLCSIIFPRLDDALHHAARLQAENLHDGNANIEGE